MDILEFSKIIDMLCDQAITLSGKEKLVRLQPFLDEVEVKNRMRETTEAKRVIESLGNPPISSMVDMDTIMITIKQEGLLTPEQLTTVGTFLVSCRRLRQYLKRSEYLQVGICYYWSSIEEIVELTDEIERSIRNNKVDDYASNYLRDIRRKMESIQNDIRNKLEQLLKNKKECFSDSFVVTRNGRLVLPVKKEYKHQISGSIVDKSATGATYFIEPTVVNKLEEELSICQIDEENEIRRILYSLTAKVAEYYESIKSNMDIMETLDILFAKGKLSTAMNGIPVTINSDRYIKIVKGKHPLLNAKEVVPLDFTLGDGKRGIVITGPNTGGKTVALKTVGLLSLMAQSGLHVPVGEGSIFSMNDIVLCDIGDGQSISENLSTFSAHIKNIVSILKEVSSDSLVLLDELGSGTDPAEGMGIAIAILEKLLEERCLFVATTHYPQVKEYAEKTEYLINARMAFDRESLKPLYQLEIGVSGESCALYIAQRFGFPGDMLIRAHEEAYKNSKGINESKMGEILLGNEIPNSIGKTSRSNRSKIKKEVPKKEKSNPGGKFHMGDSVIVYPQKVIGIVYEEANEKGEVNVQIQGRKRLVNHKRLKLKASAAELYPEEYDFSVIFDSVENRKARHQMTRKYTKDLEVKYDKDHNA